MNKEYNRRSAVGFEASTFFTSQTRKIGDYWGPCNCPLWGKKNKAYTFAKSLSKLMCNSSSCEVFSYES